MGGVERALSRARRPPPPAQRHGSRRSSSPTTAHTLHPPHCFQASRHRDVHARFAHTCDAALLAREGHPAGLRDPVALLTRRAAAQAQGPGFAAGASACPAGPAAPPSRPSQHTAFPRPSGCEGGVRAWAPAWAAGAAVSARAGRGGSGLAASIEDESSVTLRGTFVSSRGEQFSTKI